jgi:hypothetical protein
MAIHEYEKKDGIAKRFARKLRAQPTAHNPFTNPIGGKPVAMEEPEEPNDDEGLSPTLKKISFQGKDLHELAHYGNLTSGDYDMRYGHQVAFGDNEIELLKADYSGKARVEHSYEYPGQSRNTQENHIGCEYGKEEDKNKDGEFRNYVYWAEYDDYLEFVKDERVIFTLNLGDLYEVQDKDEKEGVNLPAGY